MPLTPEELDSFPEPIVNRDPGDETTFDQEAEQDRRLTELENREAMAQDAIQHLNDLGLLQGADIRALFARTDRLAQGLAHLTVTVVEMRDRPSLLRRLLSRAR